jgi:telomere length regulation protein
MADFLTAVSTKKIVSKPVIEEIQNLSIQNVVSIDSAQSALQALKSEPSHGTVSNVLEFFSSSKVSLITPEPVYASIAHELVNNVIPNFWGVLKHHAKDAQRLATTLRNSTGIGHLITRLRSLIAENRQRNTPGNIKDVSEFIKDTLDVLGRVLSGEDVSYSVWKEIQAFGRNDMQRKLIWKEFLAQVASGRVLSVRAEAEDAVKEKEIELPQLSGNDFAEWLGRNIFYMLTVGDKSAECFKAVVDLSSKVLTLGYTGK